MSGFIGAVGYNVLLLDASFSALPLYEALREMGATVWVVGNRPGDALAQAFPDFWIQADYSDAIIIAEIVKEYGITNIVPGCTDVSMTTFSRLQWNEVYKYDIQIDSCINKKDRFREICAQLSLPAPRAIQPDNLPQYGRFICKPVDGFSGVGISCFDAGDKEALMQALQLARQSSPSGKVVCESFIEGQLYSYSVFLHNQSVKHAFFVKEGSRYEPYSVDVSYVAQAEMVPGNKVLTNAVERLARALNLCDGLLHVQFISSIDGPQIVEVTRRCPGDLYARLIEESTGFPYAMHYVAAFLGRECAVQVLRPKFVLRHTCKQLANTVFRQLDLPFSLQSSIQIVPLRMPGEYISGVGYQRTAVLFSKLNSLMELQSAYCCLTQI